jgi:glycyl-tRNA synthetase beta chain
MPDQVRHDDREEGQETAPLSYTPEKEEAALISTRFRRPPGGRIFSARCCDDPDPAKRAARLDLLPPIRDAVHRVVDVSRVEG